jgi:beta-glucosidase
LGGSGFDPFRAGVDPVRNFIDIDKDTTYHARWIPETDNVRYVTTKDNRYRNGEEVTLGYSVYSGVKLIDAGGAAVSLPYTANGTNPVFKDLNGNGRLDVYEDWREGADARSADLAAKLKADPDGVKQIAGLMLYSAHQFNWTTSVPTQEQLLFLVNDDLRHVLIAASAPPGKMAIHAQWNNYIQSIVEGLGYGIPANNSSDPRHGTSSQSNVEYYSANSGVSAWPSSLGLAATFDTNVTRQFGKIASIEYRAMGIATALSPQIDIATDPRWSRFNGTFGEDPKLASAMSRAYVDGFQTTYDKDTDVTNDPARGGWGFHSVNAMMKHWPGGGAGEGGRDAHFNYGKYAVFPGGNWKAHLIPFVDGSLSLQDGTNMATAVMPYYTISYLQVPGSVPNYSNLPEAKLNMANAYSDYMINGVLRDSYKFEGVVCTDWNVVGPKTSLDGMFDPDISGMIWGVDDHFPEYQGFDLDGSYTNMGQRARLLLDAGVDQFGGLNTTAPIEKAYADASAADRARLLNQLEQSAVRLLKNIFRTSLFENPYLDVEESETTIGNAAYVRAGYEAQLKSTVLLKNKGNVLPLNKNTTRVYVPQADEAPLNLLGSYFGASNVSADNASNATVALVFMSAVSAGGGNRDANAHRNTYLPVNLDYKPYTASAARLTSVAGEPLRDSSGKVTGMENRSYSGATVEAAAGNNPAYAAANQLARLQAAKASGKPVIVVINVTNPPVLVEIEPSADAIVANFESQNAAVLDLITGSTKYGVSSASSVAIRPTAMLPMQFPKDMTEAELQYEDVPRDMMPYTDSEGNVYDFGFGLSWDNNRTVAINAQINPGYTEFVQNNRTPMTKPVNLGDGSSAYSIEKRRQVKFDFGFKDFAAAKENKNLIKVVNTGGKVTAEPGGNRQGYEFDYWNGPDGTAYDFNAPVTADITLTAVWRSR